MGYVVSAVIFLFGLEALLTRGSGDHSSAVQSLPQSTSCCGLLSAMQPVSNYFLWSVWALGKNIVWLELCARKLLSLDPQFHWVMTSPQG
jgi:hypothetical protein